MRYGAVLVSFLGTVSQGLFFLSRAMAISAVELRQGAEDELVPLVAERLACNIATISYTRTNVPMERRDTAPKLHSNACNELTSVAHISATLCKEKASPKLLLLEVSASDSAGNRRLSRTS